MPNELPVIRNIPTNTFTIFKNRVPTATLATKIRALITYANNMKMEELTKLYNDQVNAETKNKAAG